MTYDKLTPKQRRYFSETMKLTEDQTAALLDNRNANESYTDFVAKAEKKQKDDLSAKEMMQKQLQATAQTMYAFGAAFDRVTVAIAKAIKPLLEVLGLAKRGGKDFNSFGQVMEGITQTVIHFFESLAGNDKWMDFMQELGKDLQKAGTALKDFVMSGRAADLVGDMATGMKSFYTTVRDLAVRAVPLLKPLMDVFVFLTKHIQALALAWGGMKIFNMAGGAGLMGGLNKVGGGALGMLGGGSKLAGAGRLGFAGAAGAVGGAIGGTGAGIGAGLGGLVGSFLGPLGMALGPIVGGFIGKGLEKLFGSEHTKTQLEIAQDHLTKTIEEEEATRRSYDAIADAGAERQKADDAMRRARNNLLTQLDKKANVSKEKEITLSADEATTLRDRAAGLAMFSDSTKVTKEMLEHLGEGSRLTRDQLDNLVTGSKKYEQSLMDLRDAADQYLKLQQAQLGTSMLGTQKGALEAVTKSNAADIQSMQLELAKHGGKLQDTDNISADKIIQNFDDRMKYIQDPSQFSNTAKGASLSDSKKVIEDWKKNNGEEYKQIELSWKIWKKQKENVDNEEKLQKLQTDFLKQSTIINLRAQEMGSTRFMDFQKGRKFGSDAEAFAAYLTENKSSLSDLYGESGFGLLSQKPNFDIPKMADGGVVARPTVAMIGESGPEAVVPLRGGAGTNYAGGSSGGPVIVVEVHNHADAADMMRTTVRKSFRSSGGN